MAEKKKLNHLQRAQAKAIYNFHTRKRAQEEEAKLQEQLESGTFFEEQLNLNQNAASEDEKKGKK
jgi:hypothetical protein